MQEFKIIAEHTQGASVDHCCRTGQVDDPISSLTDTIWADDAKCAVDEAYDQLELLVNEWTHDCSRRFCPGSNNWYESVFIEAVEPGT